MYFFENVSGTDTSRFSEMLCQFFCLKASELNVAATNKVAEKYCWFIDNKGSIIPDDLQHSERIAKTSYLICATGLKSKNYASENSPLYVILYPAQYAIDSSCALYNYFVTPQLVPGKFLGDKNKNRMTKALPKATIAKIKEKNKEIEEYYDSLINAKVKISIKEIAESEKRNKLNTANTLPIEDGKITATPETLPEIITKLGGVKSVSEQSEIAKQNELDSETETIIKPANNSSIKINAEDNAPETLAFERSQFAYIADSIATSALSILYNLIHNKESWARKNYSDLARYIAGLKIKALNEYEITKTSGSGYIVAPDGTEAVINTGLLDNFANDILIVDGQFDNPTGMFMFVVPERGLTATQNFKTADVPNIMQFAPVQDLVFDPSNLKESNLSFNTTHILQTRRDRFPEAVKALPTLAVLSLFESALARAIKIQRRDYKYFLPMYNFTLKQIDFLIPLYLLEDLQGVPEVVGILSKQDGKYILRTIISTDNAYANARLIAPLEASWLSR